MSIVIIIPIVFSAVVLTIAVAVGLRIMWLNRPTKGKGIVQNELKKAALVIIDIQNDTIDRTPYINKEEVLKNIRSCTDIALKRKEPIIYIKQEYSNILDIMITAGMYKRSGSGSDISRRIKTKSNNIFSKTRSDAFSAKDFENFLIENDINTLYLVGADTSACIYKTALGARNRGYDVTVLKEASFSKSEAAFEAMLEKYEKDNIVVESINDF